MVQHTSLETGSEPQLVIQHLRILGSTDSLEIEIDASDRVTPQPQTLTGPDRLVFDFPNAVPGADLRSQSIYVGAVKDIRAGLFRSNPPITRLVIDLDRPETYQIFPLGRTVMLKMSTTLAGGNMGIDPWREPALQPVVAAANAAIMQPSAPPEPPRPSLEVRFANGLLSIKADRVSLAEILRNVQQHTGADISIAPGADQEKVVSDLGPAPAQEVLARLLHGSKFNFLILNAADDPKKLDRVILTPRTEGGPAPLPPLQTTDQSPQPEPAVSEAPPGQPSNPGQGQFQPDPGGIPRPELNMPVDPEAPQ
jgi:AMIN domain